MKTASALPRVERTSPQKGARRRNPEPKPQIASILVPVDFSSASVNALLYAGGLAKQYNAKVIPMFVVELPEVVGMFQLLLDDDEISATFKAKLLKFARKGLIPGALIDHALVRKGRPHREITEAARTLKVDLIVISTHGYSGLERAVVGSVTERVVRDAPCPVLVVRENEREFITRDRKRDSAEPS